MKRNAVCTLLVSLGLLFAASGCNQSSAPEGPSADAPTALVYGMANSPIFDALESQFMMTQWNGSQKASDFDLIVVDGDGFTAEQLGEEAFIHNAIRSGVWVLGLDVEEDDKRDGLGYSLNAATPESSPAYLVRQTRRPDGHQLNTFIDFSDEAQTAEATARQIVSYLKNPELEVQQAPPSDIPPRLLYVTYRLVTPLQVSMPQNPDAPFYHPDQTATWNVTHSVTIFLDANNDPQGNFQHILVETDGLANPNGPVVNTINSCSNYNGECEIAWLQTRFDTSHTITPDGGGSLVLKATSPHTTNNTETVTTGSSFNVGYNQAQGLFGSYTYSNSVTKTISDWTADDVSNNAGAHWEYASQNPYNGVITDGFDDSAWFYYFSGVAPKTPNNLSVEDLEYTMQSYWTNTQVSEDWISIGGTDSAWYTDAWVEITADDRNPGGNAPHCIAVCGYTQHMQRYNNVQRWSLKVNMATVIPVPTQSLTFNHNPVVAGQSPTATLTLASPTPLDAVLLISSDKAGIAPEHNTYTIPAGQASISFPVNTGAQGCEPQSATISAFYADGQNGVLSVSPPPNCQ